MYANPFSPIFGGKPDVFFGRERILNQFDLAMIDKGSDIRAMFITGMRGSGKTALLEQLSLRAGKKNKTVIDLGPENTISQLIYELAGFDETTSTINPQANVNILGSGGGISVGSVSKTKHAGRANLQSLLLDACKKSKNGIFVTVDEVQKVPIEDMSSLCNIFQMASRKGMDIMLAVAGLPYAYDKITRYEGCTYLRRATHEELGLFTWEEASSAFTKVFSVVKGLKIESAYIDRLNKASFGHPYLMQLLGYHLILQINERNPKASHEVRKEELEDAVSNALLTYEQRALKPLLEELPTGAVKYLTEMSRCLGEDRIALTSDISQGLGISQSSLGKTRAYLIDHGIVASPGYGKLLFCVPYLADYIINNNPAMASNIEVAMQRKV